MKLSGLSGLFPAILACASWHAQAQESLQPASQEVALPGSPFSVIPSADGASLFVSLSGPTLGIAVLAASQSTASLSRVIATRSAPYGLALSRDGRYLASAQRGISGQSGSFSGVQIIDATRAASGSTAVGVTAVAMPYSLMPIKVTWGKGNRYLFVSNEGGSSISVVDVARAVATGGSARAIVGNIPMGRAPVGLAVSTDGRYLYAVSQIADPSTPGYNASACPAGNTLVAQGSLSVVDVAKATIDPAHAVIAVALAGCSPVRIALSADDATAWVTARGEDALLSFSTSLLRTSPSSARTSRTPVGSAPVGLLLFNQEQHVAIANSNRFDPTQTGTISIVRKADALSGAGASATVATFMAGKFPREWAQSADGKQLYLTQFGSSSLAIWPVSSLLAGQP